MIPGSSILTSVMGYLFTEYFADGRWTSKPHRAAYDFVRGQRDLLWHEEMLARAEHFRRAA